MADDLQERRCDWLIEADSCVTACCAVGVGVGHADPAPGVAKEIGSLHARAGILWHDVGVDQRCGLGSFAAVVSPVARAVSADSIGTGNHPGCEAVRCHGVLFATTGSAASPVRFIYASSCGRCQRALLAPATRA